MPNRKYTKEDCAKLKKVYMNKIAPEYGIKNAAKIKKDELCNQIVKASSKQKTPPVGKKITTSPKSPKRKQFTKEDCKSLKKVDMNKIAAEYGIKNAAKIKKDDLCNELINASRSPKKVKSPVPEKGKTTRIQQKPEKDSGKTDTLKQLESLKSFYVYENVLDRNIVFMGEKHHLYTCSGEKTKTKDWLIGIAKEASKKGRCIDLYIEDKYTNVKKLTPFESILVSGMTKTKDAYRNGEFPNDSIRYHYSDTRKIISRVPIGILRNLSETKYKNTLMNLIITKDKDIMKMYNKNYIKKIVEEIVYAESYSTHLEFITTIYRKIFGFKHDPVFLTMMKRNLDNKKYDKTNSIEEFFDVVSKDYIDNFSKIIKKQIKKLDPRLNIDTILDIFVELIMEENEMKIDSGGFVNGLFLFTMDLYLILRLFKVFDTTQKTSVTYCQNQKTAKNAIVYSGDHHTRVYVKFLYKLGKYKPVIEKRSRNNCIKLDKPFKYPIEK